MVIEKLCGYIFVADAKSVLVELVSVLLSDLLGIP